MPHSLSGLGSHETASLAHVDTHTPVNHGSNSDFETALSHMDGGSFHLPALTGESPSEHSGLPALSHTSSPHENPELLGNKTNVPSEGTKPEDGEASSKLPSLGSEIKGIFSRKPGEDLEKFGDRFDKSFKPLTASLGIAQQLAAISGVGIAAANFQETSEKNSQSS